MTNRFGVPMDLESIYEHPPVAYENLLKNSSYIVVFKDDLIRFTFSKMEHTMLTNSGIYQNNSVPFSSSIEDNSATSPFQTTGINTNAYRH